MNDRAIELYKDALRFAYDNTESTDPKHIVDSLAVGKFAELLVRECSKVILDEMDKCPDTKEWHDWVNGMDEAQAAIKVHFGIEE